jgi:hypothetical protein
LTLKKERAGKEICALSFACARKKRENEERSRSSYSAEEFYVAAASKIR